MPATDGVGEQHRVEAEEQRRRQGGPPQASRAHPDQPHTGEAGERRRALEQPDRRREAHPAERKAAEREQRAVGGRVERPAHVYVGGIGGRRGERVDVRVQMMDRVEPGVSDVVEDVAREQGRREQEDQVQGDDRADADPDPYGVREQQHAEIAEAEHDEEGGENVAAERQVQAVQRSADRARQPVMDVQGRPVVLGGGPGRHQEARDDHPAEEPVGEQRPVRRPHARQGRDLRRDGGRLDRRVNGSGE